MLDGAISTNDDRATTYLLTYFTSVLCRKVLDVIETAASYPALTRYLLPFYHLFEFSVYSFRVMDDYVRFTLTYYDD